MEVLDSVVGIDVSKDGLDVHVHRSGEAFACVRDADGLDALLSRLAPLRPALVAIEATGGFETVAAARLAAAGLPVAVVNPAQVRAFATALGKRAKTDPIDALVIARFAATARPQPKPAPDETLQALPDLTTRRRQIVAMIGAEKQREKRAPARLNPARLKKSIARLLKALQKELSEVEDDIDDTMRSSPLWREKEDLLTSVPGIGQTIARALLADLPELGQISRHEIAALAGLAPHTRQSGQWKGQSFISGGRAEPRSCLFIAAMVAMRHNPPLKAFYLRLTSAGKPKKLALIAVARKLLVTLNAIIRDRKPWQHA